VGGTWPPLENLKARLASIATFCFTQKQPKSLPRNSFHKLKIDLNALSAGPRWGSHSALPCRHLAGFKGALCSEVKRTGYIQRGEGRERKRGKRRTDRQMELNA